MCVYPRKHPPSPVSSGPICVDYYRLANTSWEIFICIYHRSLKSFYVLAGHYDGRFMSLFEHDFGLTMHAHTRKKHLIGVHAHALSRSRPTHSTCAQLHNYTHVHSSLSGITTGAERRLRHMRLSARRATFLWLLLLCGRWSRELGVCECETNFASRRVV